MQEREGQGGREREVGDLDLCHGGTGDTKRGAEAQSQRKHTSNTCTTGLGVQGRALETETSSFALKSALLHQKALRRRRT